MRAGRSDTRPLWAPLGAAAVAWSSLLTVEGSPLAWVLDHEALALTAVPLVRAVPGYAVGWSIMVAAMMLPAALWLARPGRLPGWLAGYLLAWGLAGFAFAGADLALHALVPAGSAFAAALPAVAVVAAALWLTAVAPGARRHPPRGLVGAAGGWSHGLACLYTCWPAMLALQAVAPGDVRAMAVVTALLTGLRLGGRAGPAAQAGGGRKVRRAVAPTSPSSSSAASCAAATARTTLSPSPSRITVGKPGPVSETSR